jgi:hypothetical protein
MNGWTLIGELLLVTAAIVGAMVVWRERKIASAGL